MDKAAAEKDDKPDQPPRSQAGPTPRGWAHISWSALWEDFPTTTLAQNLRKLIADNKDRLCPAPSQVLRALELTGVDETMAVVLGQDPYPNPQHACGLAFSVPKGTRPLPGSLQNIIRAVKEQLGACAVSDGDLTPWAEQGILLLNTALTTIVGKPAAHKNCGWEEFVGTLLQRWNRSRAQNDRRPVLWLLWGRHAQNMAKDLEIPTFDRVLSSCHPSPLSASRGGFFSNGHFVKLREFAQRHYAKELRL